MKTIPKDDLIKLIELIEDDVITKDRCSSLFEVFGDEYYHIHNFGFEKCLDNEYRAKVLSHCTK